MSELPNIIKNQNNSEISYELGKFLGKGGFAKCYEFRQMSDGKVYAGKVVPKTLLSNDLVMVSSLSTLQITTKYLKIWAIWHII